MIRRDPFTKNPAPRMAANTPTFALVVFDGWMGGGAELPKDELFKMMRELTIGTHYSVAEVVHVGGRLKVILNEVSGVWDASFFAAHK